MIFLKNWFSDLHLISWWPVLCTSFEERKFYILSYRLLIVVMTGFCTPYWKRGNHDLLAKTINIYVIVFVCVICNWHCGLLCVLWTACAWRSRMLLYWLWHNTDIKACRRLNNLHQVVVGKIACRSSYLVMRIRGLLMFMFPIMAFDAAYYFFEGKKIISFCRGSDVCNIPKVFILK